MKKVFSTVAFASLFACVLSAGCSKTTVRTSSKGEACQVTNDCGSGLSCLPRSNAAGGVCVTGEFKITPTAKECAVIQCNAPADCCPTLSTNCTFYDEQCKAGGTNAQTYCDQYKSQCVCDTASWTCTAGACSYEKKCTTDPECGAGACSNGRCTQCKTKAQCGDGNSCVAGKCVQGCSLDSDCASFNRCQSGQCVPGTCQSDRECVAASGNVEAKCNAAQQKCVVPCQTDLECGSSQDYRFYSCIANECIYTGCENDKECELYLERSGSSSTTNGTGTGTTTKKNKIVCRDHVAAK